jgi:hypothetical protein
MARTRFGPSGILLIVAVACFIIAAFGVDVGELDLTNLGLAAFAAAVLLR